MLRSEARRAGLTVPDEIEQRGWGQVAVDAVVDHGVELVFLGASHVVRSLVRRWKDREPEAKIDWREPGGYR